MGKRYEIKQKRKQQKLVQNGIVIGIIAVISMVIAFILIWPNLQSPKDITVPEYTTYPVENVPEGETGMGDPNAPVKLEIFADFQCPACANLAINIEPKVVRNYVENGNVYLTFHPYSFLDKGTIGQESHRAAEAAFCALDQKMFWQYYDILFHNHTGENVGDYTKSRLIAYAEKLGMNMTEFTKCVNDRKYEQKVLDENEYAQSLGVDRTPTFFINGQKLVLVSSYDELFQALDLALK